MGAFGKSIDEIAENGNALFDEEKYMQAVEVWQEGLELLEKPLNAQSEAVWFQASIADALFMLGEYERAYSYLLDAKADLSGEGYADPFVMMRLGQCAYELKKEDFKEYLLRAYMLAGEEIFENDDEKYLGSIKDLI